ncbi:hypothetical protein DFH11DRAFT_1723647 [Phellopilus nigrolimitatus]|nr:hypothetical protein DFH11DRAFT_1723647 [Phellopilus nigrolimitatus]
MDMSECWDSSMNMDTLIDFDAMSGTSSKSDRSFSPSAVLTPPDSHAGSPVDDQKSEGNTLISVSTTFFPGANNDSLPTDLIVLSSDSVFFYVHSQRLLSASENGFNSHLPVKREDDSDPILNLAETSTVINIVLHSIYGMSCSHYSPSLADLSAAIAALRVYGLSINSILAPGSPLSSTLLSYAPTQPIELYALASTYGLHDIAVSTSPHLLSFALPTLTDDMAVKIGAIYLKKLFFLHLGRTDALKRLILSPPHPHAPTPTCDFVEQKKLTRAWALATAYLTWDARPDMSAGTIESALCPLADHLSCDLCRTVLRERIRDLVVQWSVVKRTI